MPDTIKNTTSTQFRWQTALWLAALFGATLLLVFYQTTWSMVSIWLRSETFAHGFLILPISLWLVWDNRNSLSRITARPAPLVALLMVPLGFVWLLANLVDVLVVQQLALVALLVVGVWAIVGHQMARVLAFPLLFLFFAVPMGEELVPPMMEFTATSTVWLIQQTGIPVYREGLYFTLPSGSWSVVAACSGVRYIIASVTLGILYAYLSYRSTWRRILFVMISAIIPIFANTLRAYIIVMLGHWSDMKVATGADHLIYGWVFFGLVMFLLFWVGSYFSQDSIDFTLKPTAPNAHQPMPVATSSGLVVTLLIVLLVSLPWPWLALASKSHPQSEHLELLLPEATGAWVGIESPPWQWQPDSSVGGETAAFYQRNGNTLGLFIQYPDGSESGGEVVGSSTRFGVKNSDIRMIARDHASARLGGAPVVVDEARLQGADVQLLAWSFYRVGDMYTSNNYVAKFREAWASLGIGVPGAYRIVIVLPMQDSIESTQALMQDFLDAHDVLLVDAFDQTAAGGQ